MKLKLIYLLAFVLFFPSLFNYFSHDDFFILRLAKINSLTGFLSSFNLFSAPDRLGSYRPLTTQVYFLISHLFNLSPTPLHIIAYLVFFTDIYLVKKLTDLLLKNERASLVAAFLYATSATHFAHLYWPSLFQELGLVFFFLLSTIFFLKNKNLLSLLALIGGLMSKETAIMIPFVLTFLKPKTRTLLPFFLIVGIFLFVHFFFYGMPPGDVYKIDFSLKILNTFFWYILWAFNLPELFVDFVGPGINLNPNLLNFYGRETAIILILFLSTIVSFLYILKRGFNFKYFLLGSTWFLLTLLPVIFLPWHKFTYELGIPLVGLVIFITSLTKNISRKILSIFCFFWLATSVATLYLTINTHWITLGPKITWRVKIYFENYAGVNKIVFYDTKEDKVLPWSPTNELKINLFNNDFFEVYYPGKYTVTYVQKTPQILDKEVSYIPARQFLGY